MPQLRLDQWLWLAWAVAFTITLLSTLPAYLAAGLGGRWLLVASLVIALHGLSFLAARWWSRRRAAR